MSTTSTTPDQPSLAELVQTIKANVSEWKSNSDMATADFNARQRAVEECDRRLKLAVADHKAAADNLRFLLGVKGTLAALVDDINNPEATTLGAWNNPAGALARRNSTRFSWTPLDPEYQRITALDRATSVFNQVQDLVKEVNEANIPEPDNNPNSTTGNASFLADLEHAKDCKAKALSSLRTALQLSMRTVVATELVRRRIEYYQGCLRTAMGKTDDMLPTLENRVNSLSLIVENSTAELRRAGEARNQAQIRMESARLIAAVTDNSSSMVNQVSRLPGA